jgi:hypothetical protein
MFDVRRFYEDYDIEYLEGDESHKHCRPGWVQAECPRCTGNPGYHLGFSEDSGMFVCWRCGYMPLIEAIRRFTGKSWPQAKAIARQYGGGKTYRRYKKTAKEKDIDCKLPKETLDYMPKRHRRYLENRNFDPDRLMDIWDIQATGKFGPYANRIIAPVYYRNILMSFQGRDVTGESELPYKACTMDNEKRHHKHCLYGMDLAISESVLVVEGITDVWRMGIGAVATFGIKYTEAQVLLLYHHFRRIYVMFDETEKQAQDMAKQLVHQLCTMGRKCEHIQLDINHDPGDLSDKDAQYVMRELLIR